MIEPLTEARLVAILREQWSQADNYYATEIEPNVSAAISFYNAEPFGDEVEGLSQIILPDVQDAVDYMTTQIIKPFVSGDRVVEFEARNPVGADKADEALEAVSQTFMRGQHGFRVIHDWVKAGLKEDYCALKSTVRIDRKLVREQFIADADQLAMVDDATAQTAIDNGDGTFTITSSREVSVPVFEDYTLPSEEFRFSPRARSEDAADYLAHVCRKTRSDLVEMGFDAEAVYALPTGDAELLGSTTRDYFDETDNSDPSMQEVWLYEEYITVDYDGDGIAERLQVFRVGDTLLSVEPTQEQPFTVWTPYAEPHRMIGKGLGAKAMTGQRVRSVVVREMLNAFYRGNQPRWWVPEESTTDTTIEDLLETVGPVRGRGAPPTLLGTTFDPGKTIGMLEFFTREREFRTGITDINQGVAPDMLNTTATGAAIQDERGAQSADFLIRVFAESLARAFLKKMKLLKAVGQKFHVKMDGEYREVDPESWPDEVDVLIRTGLGTGKKDVRIAHRLQMLEIQREGVAVGLVKPEHLFKTAAGLVKDMGLGQPDDYFANPANADPSEPQPPSPEEQQLQMEAQLQQAKLAGEQQIAQQRMDLARAEAEAQAQLARDKAALEADLAQAKLDMEIAMAERRMEFEQSLAERRAAHQAQMDRETKLPSNRPGGSLAE